METLQAVASALALGAAAGLKDSAAQAVKDAYASLRELLQRRLPEVMGSVEQLERAPDSKARQLVVSEDLARAGAKEHAELFESVQALLASIERHAPLEAQRLAVDLRDLKARTLSIARIRSDGAGVRVTGARIDDAVNISDVEVSARGDPDPNA